MDLSDADLVVLARAGDLDAFGELIDRYLIRRHRADIGSRWRRLNPGQQALLVMVNLRKG